MQDDRLPDVTSDERTTLGDIAGWRLSRLSMAVYLLGVIAAVYILIFSRTPTVIGALFWLACSLAVSILLTMLASFSYPRALRMLPIQIAAIAFAGALVWWITSLGFGIKAT